MTKTALITGGAGAIAIGLAHRLVERDYRLILVDLDEKRLQDAAARLQVQVEFIVADLSVPADVQRVVRRIETGTELDLLVNNAGVIRPGRVVDLSPQQLEQHISINLLAPMLLTQAAARGMMSRRSGCILSLVSAAALVALPGSAAYSASKFGLRGFLIALSQELSSCGVRVRGVFPGAVDTPMLRYEATHGGSVLNFLNKDVLSIDEVVDACLSAMDGDRLETHLPFWDGVTARVICAAPGLMPRLLPFFEKQGRAGLQRYLASRGLVVASPDAPDAPPAGDSR